jgi:cytochrome d ubiquinol oxidase subunit I
MTHVWLGAFLSGAFLVLSVSAYYLRKKRHVEFSRKSFKISLAVATVVRVAATGGRAPIGRCGG